MLRILEQKSYVVHRKEGRAFVYSPLLDRRQARRRAVSQLLSRFFDGSPELLVLNLLEEDQVDQQELRRLRTLIEDGIQESST
jgi:predicted transcriptional regulator